MTLRYVGNAVLIAAAVLFLAPQLASAQFGGNQFQVQSEPTIQLDPRSPRPGEQVKVTLNDQGTSGYGSKITWIYNGGEISDAENQREVVVTAGDLGENAVIQAVLTSINGGQQVVRATIKPIYVDIVLEAQTYTPPFYLGGAVPSINSMVNATVLINDGQPRGGNSYLYRWQLDRTVLEGGPIQGGDSVSFEMPMGNSAILIVEVRDAAGNLLGDRGVMVTATEPRIGFYDVNSLYGISNRTLNSQTVPLIGNSTTLRAVPYFLDTRTYNNPDVLEWTLDGRVVQNTASNPYNITLQGAIPGSRTDVGFHVRSLQQVLQGARDEVTVSY